MTHLAGLAVALATAKASPKWTFSGTADLLQNAPTVGGEYLQVREYDGAVQGPRLINARFSAKYLDPKSGFSALIEPWIGDTTDILWRGEPSGSSFWKYAGQFYGTYTSKQGWDVNLGKALCWIGYEGALNADGDFLSRGLLYTNIQPDYDFGAWADDNFGKNWGASLFVVNGWNQVERAGGGVTIGSQIRYQANRKLSLTLGTFDGDEGSNSPNRSGSFGGITFPGAGVSRVDQVDFIATWRLDPKTLLAYNGDGASSRGDQSGHWWGSAVYLHRDLSSVESINLRLDQIEDTDGARFGAPASVSSGTLEWDRKLSNLLEIRLEGRTDWANAALFTRNGTARKSQTSVAVGLTARF